jgi:glycosyltransferase involved in cell wall biosynthesis
VTLTTIETPPGLPAAPAPVVLFLPAHDEQAAVGGVVARVPDRVCGRPVECVVIDDGSSDRTAVVAAAAGATVVALDRNRGLGAAVRVGLAEGVRRGAAAVAFCDADGEYSPEELHTLVGPILAGDADYVVGSRFTGKIERMHPHRRLGNRVLTWALRGLTRRPITDGQSGYRALSPAAAATAQIAHDFNYAQVLTLDLLGRGFRYREVPISYRFRETGTSFVRLVPYLRAVVPAVWRQWRATYRRRPRRPGPARRRSAMPPSPRSWPAQSSTTWDRNTARAADQELVSN